MQPAGQSLVTTAPAPTRVSRPTLTPGRNAAPGSALDAVFKCHVPRDAYSGANSHVVAKNAVVADSAVQVEDNMAT